MAGCQLERQQAHGKRPWEGPTDRSITAHGIDSRRKFQYYYQITTGCCWDSLSRHSKSTMHNPQIFSSKGMVGISEKHSHCGIRVDRSLCRGAGQSDDVGAGDVWGTVSRSDWS